MDCKIHLSGTVWYWWVLFTQTSVAAYVFGPPGSGSVSTRCGSGSSSGSFCHHANIVSKTTLIPTVWLLHGMTSNKQKKPRKFFFLVASRRSLTKISGSRAVAGSLSQRYRSGNPDPYQHVTDLQHFANICFVFLKINRCL
jgi:hypothetical protein